MAARLPPQAIEAEQSVLGGLLLDNSAWDRIADLLVEADFYRSDHRLIFQHVGALIERGKPADTLTVAEALERAGKLGEVGGRPYLAALSLNTPSAANVRRYAELVRERAVARAVIAAGASMIEAADSARPVEEVLDEADARILALREGSRADEPTTLRGAVSAAIRRADELHASGRTLAGISTGLQELDRITGGLEAGDLIVVGARPSVGKTSLGLGIAEHVARNVGPVVFFSMEMSAAAIGMRYLAARARVPVHRIRTGQVAEDEWPRIAEAPAALDLPLFIDDRPAATVGYVRARSRRLARKHGKLALVVVDYLTLMTGAAESRDERVGANAQGLKALGLELGVPVVALAQLNRAVESRTDKRPTLGDLRESGAVEQAADIVLFLYREELYDPATERWGIAEIIVGKQRNGPLGTIHVEFEPQLMRFSNLMRPLPPRPEPRRGGTAGVVDFKSKAAGD